MWVALSVVALSDSSHPSGCSGLDPLSRISAVFSKLGLPRSCSQSSQRSWNEFNSGPSYLWDSPATDPSPSWPASSSSPTHTATVSTHAPSLLVFLRCCPHLDCAIASNSKERHAWGRPHFQVPLLSHALSMATMLFTRFNRDAMRH